MAGLQSVGCATLLSSGSIPSQATMLKTLALWSMDSRQVSSITKNHRYLLWIIPILGYTKRTTTPR